MKKKIYALAFISALFLTGCSNDNDFINASQENVEISFDLNESSVAKTRGVVEGTTMTQDFSVWGYMSGTGIPTPGYVMNDASFDKDGNPMNDAHYYWIVSDDNSNVNAQFTCLSPISQAHTFANDKVTAAIVTPTVTTSPKNDENAVDVLYANVTTNPTKNRVPVTFKHALAWVEFQGKFAANITDVKIKSIVFSTNINTTGNFVLNTTDNGKAWNTVATPVAIQFGDESVALNSTSYTTLTDALLIPQDVPAQVTITYDITLGGITYTDRVITKTVNTGKDANNKDYVNSFTAGYKYIYRIYVTATEILFSPVVQPWEDTNDTNNTWQIWDEDAVAITEESFFTKASMLMGNPSVRA